jgi:hypothetical protein
MFCTYAHRVHIRKIRLLDMQLRWHAGRAVQIVVKLGCYDLQCTWPDSQSTYGKSSLDRLDGCHLLDELMLLTCLH